MRRLSKWRGGGGGSGITEEGERGGIHLEERARILAAAADLGLGRRMQKRAMPCRKTCSSVPAGAN